MRAKKLERGQLVKVFWVDSYSNHGWQIEYEPPDFARIVSSGFVVNSNNKGVTLTTSTGSENDCHGPLTIPWCAIKYVDVLPKKFWRNSIPRVKELKD